MPGEDAVDDTEEGMPGGTEPIEGTGEVPVACPGDIWARLALPKVSGGVAESMRSLPSGPLRRPPTGRKGEPGTSEAPLMLLSNRLEPVLAHGLCIAAGSWLILSTSEGGALLP